MKRLTLVLITLFALSSIGCDKKTKKDDSAEKPKTTTAEQDKDEEEKMKEEESPDEEAKSAFSLTSSAFEDGGEIPVKFTCDGAGTSPPLTWKKAPEGTKSFALVVEDPDAPKGTFYHWAAWGIGSGTTELPEGASPKGKEGVDISEAKNGFGKGGYGAPCPPKGDDAHRYRFRLFALETPGLTFMETPGVEQVLESIRGNVLEETTLTGKYKRKE